MSAQGEARSLFAAFDTAAPGANTAILATSLTPGSAGGLFRVTVALTTGSVFNVTAIVGSVEHKWGLNASTALNAGDLYYFYFGVMAGVAYNFEVETDGVIEILLIDLIHGGVA